MGAGRGVLRNFRIALAQINPTVGNLQGNVDKIIEYISLARLNSVDLIAFPEMAIPGYPPEDLIFKSQFTQANIESLNQVILASQGLTVVAGFVDTLSSYLYNSAAVAYDGKLVSKYNKIHLPNYGVFDEERYFRPGKECQVLTVSGIQLGLNICEDIWYTDGPTMFQVAAGASLIINISASPFYAEKRDVREKMLSKRASDNEAFIAYVNMIGGQDELVFDGGSVIYDPNGEELAMGSQFQEDMIVADIPIETLMRLSHKNTKPRYPKNSWSVTQIVVSEAVKTKKPKLESKFPNRYQGVGEVYQALVLGTKDYVLKSGFEKVFIALSGGIDSSVVATIATDAVGHENVIGVAMPSRYSYEVSLLDARALSEKLEIDLWELPIENSFKTNLETLSPFFQETGTGLAEENLQSRIRGTLIMAMANKFGGIVLTTGNKSEMAVGYATIYGDMAGGYSVIKDVPKTLVYKLADYRNLKGNYPVIPESIIRKPPSAELRPNQKDSDSLPPYDVLDPIIKAYVEDDLSFQEIVKLGYNEKLVQQVLTLIDRSEYKRRQSPPGVKITSRNFGRDRRMPIVNRYKPF